MRRHTDRHRADAKREETSSPAPIPSITPATICNERAAPRSTFEVLTAIKAAIGAKNSWSWPSRLCAISQANAAASDA
jgi:hypothetical protein